MARLLLGLTFHAHGDPYLSVAHVVDAPTLGTFANRSHARAAERESNRLRDPHRRRKYLSHVRSDPSVIRGAIATLEALLEHSNDAAHGPVFPSQARLARLAHVSLRTVQRHLRELSDAGYLRIYDAPPERDKDSGRWSRRKTNRYYFTFCKTAGRGRRVQRNRRSRLDDTGGVSNPLGISNHRPVEGGGGGTGLVHEGVRRPLGSRRAKPPPSAPPLPLPAGSWSDQKGCNGCDFTGWVLDSLAEATRCPCS